MVISASLVKELRDRTSSGMMDCKRALVETEGNLEKAIDIMRASGAAKAAKKATRVAKEGLVSIALSTNKKNAIIIEVNSETDFVTKSNDFIDFCQKILYLALNNNTNTLEELLNCQLDGVSVDSIREALIVKIGENITIRRLARLSTVDGSIGIYKHGSRIATMVKLDVLNQNLAKDISMHIAASNPECIDESSMPNEILAREKEIFIKQAKESGKPENIIEKIVSGKMKKFINDTTLYGQNFVKDPDISIAKLLENNNAKVLSFTRYEVGEGIEKVATDFREEVMAQVRG